MINRRTVEYEYKMISSFYDNYIRKHNYLLIKSVVLGITNEENEEIELIHKLHRFLVCIMIESKQHLMNCINNVFGFAFKRNIDSMFLTKIRKINDAYLNDVQKSLRFIEMSMNEEDLMNSFCAFVLGGIYLNHYFNDYVVVPVYLFDKLGAVVNDYEIREVFYQSLIEQCLAKHDTTIKERVIKKYIECKDEFILLGVDELWLFGSIIDETYYDDSDIDIVLKMKNGYDFLIASNYIREFNKKNFDRKSDILEQDDFEYLNHNLPKFKVL